MQSYLENDHKKANQPTSQAVLHQFPTYLYLTSYQTEPGYSLTLVLSPPTSHLLPIYMEPPSLVLHHRPTTHEGSVDLLLGCRYYLLGTVLGR